MKALSLLILSVMASAADFSFMSGAWKGALGAAEVEEHWMAPAGDNLLGMYRVVRDGKLVMSELCAIEVRPEGTVLLLRHFDRGLLAREDKDKPMSFTLESLTPAKAVFVRTAGKDKLTYERVSEDELHVTLEKERDGKKSSTPFRYRRQR